MKAHNMEALAQAIKDNTGEITDREDGDTYIMISRTPFVRVLCDILAAENPKFDKNKFMEAVK